MASFAGVDFGLIEESASFANPKAYQLNAYPGVSGVERLDMGARGKSHTVRGVLAGVSAADLSAILQGFGGLVLDGGQYTYYDANGTYWDNTILVMFRPLGPRYPLASSPTGVAQRFEALLETDL